MAAFNEFRLIGVCYGNAVNEVIPTKKDKRVSFTLRTKSNADKTKKVYVPMLAYGKVANKAAIMCRNGNCLAVKGEIVSRSFFNRNEGTTHIRLYFIVTEILLLVKPRFSKIDEKKFRDIVELFDLDKGDYARNEKK